MGITKTFQNLGDEHANNANKAFRQSNNFKNAVNNHKKSHGLIDGLVARWLKKRKT